MTKVAKRIEEEAVWDALRDLRERIKELEQEKQEPENREDMIPGPEDIGRWVEVKDSHDSDWSEPVLLLQVDSNDPNLPYRAADMWWHQARIVPKPIRGTLQKHDGSNETPDWLDADDYVIVEEAGHPEGYNLLQALDVEWNLVTYYQKVEVKCE